MHDSTVDRTTNGNGKITDLPDDYIKTLFLRDRNGIVTNETIPLFSEVLSRFKGKDIILMLDVKGDIVPEVISLVKKNQMESRCILLSFDQKRTELAGRLTQKMMISVWIENQEQWHALQKLQIPDKQLIAYISESTPPELLQEIHNRKIILMTDMSEGIRNNSIHYEPDFCRHFIENKNLGICISDYPLFVNKLFCND